ncbi:hypothetical protein SAMN06269185_0438 [Natronoarchaeum philippinense]|uniref:Uncharacterized protein n=1 Tax=Natronoarchaeum philippinense TaxID=558529 RepID=A0A285N5C7_NATPI|nr:hypothetical protein [Natronoarchaeum philippinense]SNZ04057.1 hypothetical protein SAMN06269185_0438 [Natronoarchaeum philippinense]
MATRNSRPEVPTWLAGLILVAVVAASGYVFVFGGEPRTPMLALFGAVGTGISLFTLWLFYRFVVAVETIADAQ